MRDKYVAFDVHCATISGGYVDEKGQVMMETCFKRKPQRSGIFYGELVVFT